MEIGRLMWSSEKADPHSAHLMYISTWQEKRQVVFIYMMLMTDDAWECLWNQGSL